MKRDDTTHAWDMRAKSGDCASCSLPVARCREPGGEPWHKLSVKTMDSSTDALCQAMEGRS
jgi:hypothetical protein